MNSTESSTALAHRARTATETSTDALKRGTKTLTDRADLVAQLPTLDLTGPVARYFEYVQKSVDLNRDLAIRWAELVTSLSGAVREQAESFSHLLTDGAETVADLATEQAEHAENAARAQAEEIEQAEKDQARKAKQAERAQAKHDHEQAREAYQGLTKVELSDKLAERDLPKSGTVEELIERLVSADSE
jgi:hypothetical protein